MSTLSAYNLRSTDYRKRTHAYYARHRLSSAFSTVPQRRAVGFSRGTPFFLVVFYGADFICKRLPT